MAKSPKIKPAALRCAIAERGDWSRSNQGKFFLLGQTAIDQWLRLSMEAQEAMLGRARIQNLLLAQGKSLPYEKLHGVKGKGAKGCIELKCDRPLTRGYGFHLNRKDWYLTAFVEGQHPSNAEVTAFGVDCNRLRALFLGERTDGNSSGG